MLYTILYISNAERAFNNTELQELVSESRTWNSLHGITGFLAYVEGVLDGETRCQFIQVIEGKKSDMEDVFTIIEQDPRHQDICVIKEGYINKRKFESWNMGFERLHLISNPKLELFFSMNLSVLSEDGDLDNNVLIDFMKTFYDQKEQSRRDLQGLDDVKHHSL
ncbi:MAG: BLUF domain-containing protein [Pedobacter sp.]